MDLDLTNIYNFINENDVDRAVQNAFTSIEKVTDKSGRGSDFLGWVDIPFQNDLSLEGYDLTKVKSVAGEIQEKNATLICIGIGGSYLGHRSVIEAIKPYHKNILYAGQNIDSDHLNHIVDTIEEREEVYLNPISKSGTTTEPGIAFRVLRKWMENRYGDEEAAQRIIATTDRREGALRKLADETGYRTFSIPDDVGGRYTVLTPVGLFPIAAAGIEVEKLIRGARTMANLCVKNDEENPALRYAAVRAALYNQNKVIEILSTFNPRLDYFTEWWKQLAGESEGKEGQGIFPSSAVFSTDLHSLGQWIQDGPRIFFETFLIVEHSDHKIEIEELPDNADNLNYLAGKSFDEINMKAYEGTAQAHSEGGVPNLTIAIETLEESTLGKLIFFFEMAVAITGYQLGVNPFNQPGVEAYKSNMFKLLGKPGFQD